MKHDVLLTSVSPELVLSVLWQCVRFAYYVKFCLT